jgi:alpha-glucosidase
MVFAGDEVGLTGIDGDGARQPMPWDPSRWDHEVLDAYRELGAVRRASRALRHGGLRWVHADGDVLVFLREACDERVLVQVARADHPPVVLAGLGGDVGAPRLGGVAVGRRSDGAVELPAGGAGVRIWELS